MQKEGFLNSWSKKKIIFKEVSYIERLSGDTYNTQYVVMKFITIKYTLIAGHKL